MSSNDKEETFFKEASNLIYKWLSDEERIQFHAELGGDFRNTTDVKPSERFFALLRFVQVKYIKVKEWIDTTFALLEKLRQKNPDFVIKDVVFSETDREYAYPSIAKIRRQFTDANSYPEGFQGMETLLRRLDLEEQFNGYVESLKGEKKE